MSAATTSCAAVDAAARWLGLERDELMRQACQRAIDMDARGLPVSAAHLAFARQWVAEHPPLGRALGTGEPA
jgi:NAD(P)H-hydrate repair Nnr-like enzyme with NAD(P)H-hydrate epimerase domain